MVDDVDPIMEDDAMSRCGAVFSVWRSRNGAFGGGWTDHLLFFLVRCKVLTDIDIRAG